MQSSITDSLAQELAAIFNVPASLDRVSAILDMPLPELTEASEADLKHLFGATGNELSPVQTEPQPPAAEPARKFRRGRRGGFNPNWRKVSVATVEVNSRGNLEIYFPSKPAPEVLFQLRSSGWKFAFSVGCWYANASKENRVFAESLK